MQELPNAWDIIWLFLRGPLVAIRTILNGSARLGEEVNKENPDIAIIRKQLEDAREQYQTILEKLKQRKEQLESHSPACLDTLISTVSSRISQINTFVVALRTKLTQELKIQIIKFAGTSVEFTNKLQDCYSKNRSILGIWP